MLRGWKILMACAVLAGCSDKKQPNIELIQDMMDSPAVKAQDYDAEAPGGRAMRLPPEGAVPVGHKPYTLKTSEDAERQLSNPLKPTDDVLYTGQKTYYTYCFVCHGPSGMGDGPVADKTMAKPPSLMSPKIRGWKDGGIFHMITAGRGMMGSFAAQIPNENDRWAVVLFVRHLQDKNR
ncbi:MAG: c-type cytochrome [Bdellovibrionales bacterium]|nr:c-type cytochrome [Bdellovibrionales bacterium]